MGGKEEGARTGVLGRIIMACEFICALCCARGTLNYFCKSEREDGGACDCPILPDSRMKALRKHSSRVLKWLVPEAFTASIHVFDIKLESVTENTSMMHRTFHLGL
jgi:hypothetical protein